MGCSSSYYFHHLFIYFIFKVLFFFNDVIVTYFCLFSLFWASFGGVISDRGLTAALIPSREQWNHNNNIIIIMIIGIYILIAINLANQELN